MKFTRDLTAFFFFFFKTLKVKLKTAKWQILNDGNTPYLRVLLPHVVFTKSYMVSLLHPPYSPNIAPADIHHFLKRKMLLKGHRFNTVVKNLERISDVPGLVYAKRFPAEFQTWQEH